MEDNNIKMTDLEILGLNEDNKLYKNIDWSEYYDFIIDCNDKFDTDNRTYDLYIVKSKHPLTGDGYYECSDEHPITEEAYLEQQILRYKTMYNITNIIRKDLQK